MGLEQRAGESCAHNQALKEINRSLDAELYKLLSNIPKIRAQLMTCKSEEALEKLTHEMEVLQQKVEIMERLLRETSV